MPTEREHGADLTFISSQLTQMAKDVRDILVHLQRLNGTVAHNTDGIGRNDRRLEAHSKKLDDLTVNLTTVQAGERVEAKFQDGFRSDVKQEQWWTRRKIIGLVRDVAPVLILIMFLAERLLSP